MDLGNSCPEVGRTRSWIAGLLYADEWTRLYWAGRKIAATCRLRGCWKRWRIYSPRRATTTPNSHFPMRCHLTFPSSICSKDLCPCCTDPKNILFGRAEARPVRCSNSAKFMRCSCSPCSFGSSVPHGSPTLLMLAPFPMRCSSIRILAPSGHS